MSDNRKYYYLKLKENYFDDDSIVLLESMQDGVLYSNILLKLYLKSLKHGGRLQLYEDIPYTAQMIATITRQQIGTVERASSRQKSNFKIIKGAIQMKRNQNFDHNHSQKLLSFRYNIDTNRVEARFTDGSAVANRMPNCLRTSSTRYFTVGLTRRIECHRFFMATAENHCNVFCVTNWSSE